MTEAGAAGMVGAAGAAAAAAASTPAALASLAGAMPDSRHDCLTKLLQFILSFRL